MHNVGIITIPNEEETKRMASFNQVVLMGNLTRDVEVRQLPSGSQVAEIGLAVNRKWRDKGSGEMKEEVGFYDVVMWGRTAEIADQYLKKGSSILIQGRLQQDRWEDKETGAKRSKVKIVCENMTMLGSRQQDGDGDSQPASQSHAQPQAQAQAQPQPAWADPNPDEIPF